MESVNIVETMHPEQEQTSSYEVTRNAIQVQKWPQPLVVGTAYQQRF